MKIMRIEGGHLAELKSFFMGVTSGHWIPPGSVLLVGSLTELVGVGLPGYLSALVDLVESFRNKFGNVIQVIPFVPLFMGGIDCAFGIRSVAELAAWLGGLGDYSLPNFTKQVWDFLARGGIGECQPAYESRHSVPIDLAGSGKKVVHCMGWPFLRSSSIAISEFEERTLITALVNDLNSGLALSLDTSPSFERSPITPASTGGEGKRIKYVVIGASHGKRLAITLSKLGHEVLDLSDGGWKLSRSSVEQMIKNCEQLKSETPSEVQIVLSILDSALFWGETEEGVAPARKLHDNRYHLEWSVILAGKDMVADRFAQAVPLLQTLSKFKLALLSPIPRFLTGGCCRDENHCSNWMEENFASEQLQNLEKTRLQLRDCVFRSRVKTVMVINPVRLFGGGRDLTDKANALKAVWGNDPVHPESEVYQRIAEELTADLGRATVNSGGKGNK